MPFRPTIKTSIQLNGTTYHFSEHPAAKGMPYGQTGRRATVYQVKNGAAFKALKVFTKAFRSHQIEGGAKRIADFSTLPGLQVCARLVLTRQNHHHLLEAQPDLEYAVVMPWVQGLTWQEIMLARQPFTKEQSLETARHFVNILAAMEERGLAHCDLSGPNILLEDTLVNLVDVEDMYGSGLEKPEKLPGGSAGYAHKTAAQGLWSAEADRFAGAVLIAEMLGWCDERVRRVGVGEQYFDAGELQIGCDRYNLLLSVLTQRYGHALAESFTSAWYSKRLEDCPRFADWKRWLMNGIATQSESAEANTSQTSNSELNDTSRYLFDVFQNKLKEKDFVEAEKLVSAILALSPGFDKPKAMLEKARQRIREEEIRKEEIKRFEQELAKKRNYAESLRAELDTVLRSCEEIEQKINQLIGGTSVVNVSNNQSVLKTENKPLPAGPKSTIAPHKGSPLLSVPKPAKALLHVFQSVAQQDYPPVTASAFLPDATSFVTFHPKKEAIIWKFKQDEAQAIEKFGLSSEPYIVSVDKAGQKLALGCKNGWVEVWDCSSGLKSFAAFDLSENITSMAFDSLGNTLAVSTGNKIHFYSFEDFAIRETMSCKDNFTSIGYSQDGNLFVYATSEGTTTLTSSSDLSLVGQFDTGKSPVFALDPESLFLCCGNENGAIHVVDIPSLKTLLSFSPLNASAIKYIAVSPSRDFLATATSLNHIHLWRLADGKLLNTSDQHQGQISGLDFHPYGRYLLSSSLDGFAIAWEIH
jgi:WD40 repeat protein